MRFLICGGRDFTNWGRFMLEMTIVCNQNGGLPEVVISGMARGADTLAVKWARGYNIKVEAYPANWDRWGKRAGYIRNREMLEEGKPDLVVAFPGGKGTALMVSIAKKAGVRCIEISSESP